MIHLVNKGEDGDPALAADFKKLFSLSFYALGIVDQHDRAIGSGKRAVSVGAEVVVPRSIEQVQHQVAVFKLKNGGGHGDSALFFELHPVGRGAALIAFGFDRSGKLEGTTVEQELFCERGFPGVGVGDDREGSASRDFFLE